MKRKGEIGCYSVFLLVIGFIAANIMLPIVSFIVVFCVAFIFFAISALFEKKIKAGGE